MECRIYNPTVTRSTLLDTWDNPQGLHYAGDPSIVYYRGLYYAGWDATPGYVENANFQHIWMTTSPDGVTWSAPFRPFRDPAYCTNPFQDRYSPSTGGDRDLQPCMLVVGTELWCVWSSGGYQSVDGYGAPTFFSRLTAPGEKWTTQRFEFSGLQVSLSSIISATSTVTNSIKASFNGKNNTPVTDWCLGACNPGLVFRNGVIAWPIAFTSFSSDPTDFMKMSKRAGLLKTTAAGTDWTLQIIDCSYYDDGAPWEPFLTENPVGHITFFSRQMKYPSNEDALGFSTSYDGGQTFPPLKPTKLIVCDAKGYVEKTSPSRWVMSHCDYLASVARMNGSLYVSRRGGNDFVPGINFTGTDPYVSYPAYCIGPDGKFRIVYGSGYNLQRKMIRMATVDAMPDDSYALVSPRSQSLLYTSAFTDSELDSAGTPPSYVFNGHQKLKGTTPLAASTACTYAAWVRMEFTGVTIIDSRNGTAGGSLLTSTGFAFGSLNFSNGFSPALQTYFHAAVVDNATKTITQYIGDKANVWRIDRGAATAGTFTLTYQGSTTAAISYNATSYTVKAALDLLNKGVWQISGSSVTGGPWNMQPPLANSAAQLTGSGSGLTGGTLAITRNFQTKVSYYQSLSFTSNPVDGDTVTIDDVVYTFRASALSTEVQIGSSAYATIANLRSKLTAAANTIQNSYIDGDHLVMAKGSSGSTVLSASSGSSAITVEGMPLGGGGVMNVGYKYSDSSSLFGWDGKIYDARFYASALSEANAKTLYNAKATAFGYESMTGASAVGTSPLVVADPASPNTTEFPALNPPPPSRCQVVSDNLLRIWGDGSASVELPWAVTRLTIAFTLGATPTGTDIYTIATFGTSDQPITLSVSAANPNQIYCGTTSVGTVSSNSGTIVVDVYTSKIRIGTFERAFGGKPRAYLGQAYPAGKLTSDKRVDFTISGMSVTKV